MRYKRRRRNRRSQVPALAGVAAVLVVVALAGGVYLWERHLDAKQPAPDTSRGMTVEEMLGLTDGEEAPVFFDGKWYQRAKGIEAYLFMGVDKTGTVEEDAELYTGGFADVQLLLVIDNTNKRFRVLQMDRDSMTDVYVLARDRSVLGVEYQQLCMAYAYGDGLESSAENTVRTLSNLLYGIPIDGYASLRMDSISLLNDMVGGVTVTIEDDLTPADPTLIQGETITLTGEQAFHYVHARKTVGDGHNTSRMRRHRTYLDGFEAQMKARMAADKEFVVKMYAALQDYLVTDIGSATLTRVAQQCLDYENGGIITAQGEHKIGKHEWMEFYPDEDDLRRIVLDLFYEEVPAEQNPGNAPSAD